MVVNHVKLDGTLASKKALTDAPLQISIVLGILRITSGTTETVNKLSGPTQPKGTEIALTEYCTF